ncbi:MAG: hypothetical protein WD276_07000 [Actinomycetota bacterium]
MMLRPPILARPVVLVAILPTFVLISALAAQANAQTESPEAHIEEETVSPTDTVFVSGSGWCATSRIEVSFNGGLAAVAAASDAGTFETEFKMQGQVSVHPGTATVTIIGLEAACSNVRSVNVSVEVVSQPKRGSIVGAPEFIVGGLILLFVVLLPLFPANIASRKGRHFWLWFLYGGVLFPIALVHSMVARAKRVCPFCQERIRAEASVCPRCQRESAPWDIVGGAGRP